MQVELRPIHTITPYDNNPRHNDGAVDAVAASLKEFGWQQPLVVDDAGVLIVGHTRLKSAIKLGMTEVPVHVASGLTAEQARAYRIADNKTATLATFDDEKLVYELMALQARGYDLDNTGFSAAELTALMHPAEAEGHGDPDAIPEPHPEAITQQGDSWHLGEHRLLCGDSTKAEDVARLMNNETAVMLWTDPPWGVRIGLDSNPRHRQRPGLINDDLSGEDFAEFLTQFASHVPRHVTGDIYVVLGASEWPTLDLALRSCGFHWSATIIWVKDVFVLGRAKFHRRFEPLWFGWHRDGKSSFQGRRDVDDVWEIARPKRSEEHPTMKPVELVCRAIEFSSAPGDIVLDLFGGSGTTLIAAEKLGRKALLMELDTHYCDVIARRWSEYFGRPAIRLTPDGERIEHSFDSKRAAA